MAELRTPLTRKSYRELQQGRECSGAYIIFLNPGSCSFKDRLGFGNLAADERFIKWGESRSHLDNQHICIGIPTGGDGTGGLGVAFWNCVWTLTLLWLGAWRVYHLAEYMLADLGRETRWSSAHNKPNLANFIFGAAPRIQICVLESSDLFFKWHGLSNWIL